MAYSTDADLLKEMSASELAKLCGDPTGVTLDSDRVAHARSNADRTIDSYLLGRYANQTTMPNTPIINKISIDLTIANLYEYAYAKRVMPGTILIKRQEAMNVLKDFQTGKVSYLEYAPTASFSPEIITNNNSKIFNKDTLNEYNS